MINVVFNYFNDNSEGAANTMSAANAEKVDKLKRQLEQLKADQIQNMKFMNQLFDHFIKNNAV